MNPNSEFMCECDGSFKTGDRLGGPGFMTDDKYYGYCEQDNCLECKKCIKMIGSIDEYCTKCHGEEEKVVNG